jgi:cbb3-type cytochrome c oxidase subunit III
VRRAVGVALLVLAALAIAGCGTEGLTSEGTDPSEGKVLFRQTCGGCHTLAEAGTEGSNPTQNPSSGPNLDDAFRASRDEGFDDSAIREVVRHQIDYPIPPMPENLLEGEEADAVAGYVALVAANPDARVAAAATADTADPKTIFESNCGSCHVLADAGTTGAVGPNLDESKPTLERAVRQIRAGGAGMPAFGGRLTDEQIQALAEYIVRVTGG